MSGLNCGEVWVTLGGEWERLVDETEGHHVLVSPVRHSSGTLETDDDSEEIHISFPNIPWQAPQRDVVV